MPCTSRVILATATVKLQNPDVEVVRETLKLMYPRAIVTKVEGYASDEPVCYAYERWQENAKGVDMAITEASQLEHEQTHTHEHQHTHGGGR